MNATVGPSRPDAVGGNPVGGDSVGDSAADACSRRRRRLPQAACCVALLLMTLGVGCAGFESLDPPIADVAGRRKERIEEAAGDFETKRDFAEFQAAMARYQQNDVDGCREALQRLLARNAQHRDARLMLAELNLADNCSLEALDQVERTLQDHPHDAQVQYTTGLLLDATGQTAGALVYYERAAELNPNDELYAISYRAALEAARRGKASVEPWSGSDVRVSSEVAPNEPIEVHSNAFATDSYTEGIDDDGSADGAGCANADGVASHSIGAGDPNNRHIPISTAVAALRRNQPEAAVELLQPVAQSGCDSAAVYRILGVAYYRLGNYRSSQVALQQALSLDKSSALTYFLIGCTWAKLGQPERAESCTRQARAIDPEYSFRR